MPLCLAKCNFKGVFLFVCLLLRGKGKERTENVVETTAQCDVSEKAGTGWGHKGSSSRLPGFDRRTRKQTLKFVVQDRGLTNVRAASIQNGLKRQGQDEFTSRM